MAKTNEKQVAKRIIQPSFYNFFFCKHKLYSKYGQPQQDFFEVLMLYVAKSYRPWSFVENPWLQRLVIHQCKWIH
jgi:hypothetical protein